MTPKLLLRLATLFLSIIALGHTVGGMLIPTSHGIQEDVLLRGLAAYRFELMGVSCSHAEFYRGEGWYLSLSLVLFAAMCWMLSGLVDAQPKVVRSLLVFPGVFCIVSTVLCGLYFFPLPLINSALASIALVTAAVKLRHA